MQFQLQITCDSVTELQHVLGALTAIETAKNFGSEAFIKKPVKEKKERKPFKRELLNTPVVAEVKVKRGRKKKEEKKVIGTNLCVVCFKSFEVTDHSQRTCGASCDKALWYRKSCIRKLDFDLKPEIVDAMALSHFIKKRSEGKIKDQRARRVIPPSEIPLDPPIETNTVSTGIPNEPFEIIKVNGKDTQVFGSPERIANFKKRIAEKEANENKTFKNNPGMKSKKDKLTEED